MFITLLLSGDAYQGPPVADITLDGVALPSVTVTVPHGQPSQRIVLNATPGPHTLILGFANDAWGGTAATDRNLYLDGIEGVTEPVAPHVFAQKGNITLTLTVPDDGSAVLARLDAVLAEAVFLSKQMRGLMAPRSDPMAVLTTTSGVYKPGAATLLSTTALTPPPPPPPPPPVNPATATLLHSFVLQNWNVSATSAGFARQGVVFKPGHVAAGNSVEVRRAGSVVAAQFDERATRADGTLALAVMHLRDTSFAASESRTYEVWTVPNIAFANVGTKAVSDLPAMQVSFTSLTETDDTPTTAAVGSGVFVADMKAALGVATRREKHHSGAVCEGWTGWGMASDATGGAADAHLKVYPHADIWKNADGSVYAVEVGGVPAQDWCSIATKRRRNYDAALIVAGATVATYAAVQHPYKAWWATVQTTTSNNRGRRHWVGGACPTLTYKPDRAYWIGAGFVPPLNLSNARTSQYSDVYVPCGTASHRPFVDGTGGYQGRGVIPNSDAIAFCRQDPADTAAARINAMCGLHIPYHYRSNRIRTRPGDGAADIASTPVSMIMSIGTRSGAACPAYDFTADGMPIPVNLYTDYRTTTDMQDGYVGPQGGTGPWQTSADASHAVNYSYFMYLMEGERYLMEATLDLSGNLVHQGIGNFYSNTPYNPLSSSEYALGANNDLFFATPGINGQERAAGWSAVIAGSAAGIVPDTHVAARHTKRLNRQGALFYKEILQYIPANMLAAGVSPETDRLGVTSPWMGAFSVLGGIHNWNLTGDPDIKAWADFIANASIGFAEGNIYRCNAYRANGKAKTSFWHPTNNPYVGGRAGARLVYAVSGGWYGGSVAAATGRVTFATLWVPSTNGDVLYVDSVDGNAAAVSHPAELSEGVPYYMVNVSGSTTQLATSPGGAPIVFAADGPVQFSGNGQAAASITVLPAAELGADGYPGIHRAAVVAAAISGNAAASAQVAKYQAFLASTDNSAWATWDYAALA